MESKERDVEGFFAYQLVIGTITMASANVKARIPAYVLTVDLGPLGIKTSSAQLTHRYEARDLIGRQVVVVANLPSRRVAGIKSEVLVLGAKMTEGDVVLLSCDQGVPNGTFIG